jgi:uncharacterized protein YcbX
LWESQPADIMSAFRMHRVARKSLLMAQITALNIYPVKSCRGVALDRARITPMGFEHDREWMIVRPDGQFVTQREEPRLALIETSVNGAGLQLRNPHDDELQVPLESAAKEVEVACWRDRCAAFDMGDAAAQWLTAFLGKPARLVRFDPRHKRASEARWTHGVEALNRFTDAFPWLLISQASLDDLNSRLPAPLPMNRFRPNIVIDGVPAYAEDRASQFRIDGVALTPVKACTRCAIPTTNQMTAERESDEPLRTLRQYRFSRELKGVVFGQNLILREGVDQVLRVGQKVEIEEVTGD